MLKRELIWDFDGTLMDTYPAMVRAFVAAVTELGGQVDNETTYQLMRQQSVGVAERQLAAKYGWDLHDLRAGYQRYEQQFQTQPAPFADAQAVLAKVQAVGGRNYLMTHRNAAALAYLEQADLKQYFTDFVTAAQPFPRKPDPAALNYLLDKHQANREVAVMVGDRNLDIDAGHNAGIAGWLFDYDELVTVTSHPEAQVTKLASLLPLIG
ncbi:HAD family hydrolase [Lactiplantibacillus mudanjiangensis]|uniref:Phosphohydrolase [Lactobacillus pentosus] n=1 Tax=Lactiplantibacillus mudanjiangensis TaxID=1296538 RepID=A0A660E4H9_9LACO|nr:HAD family hydrolase [Lactiplantibacillus mudanjiangensis]VDG25706.1 phosphohydrolase [Lactobacillus pentosus] [Lactiplantibacillus mudanjiangensis]VDG30510.1 phosphohydrolase [Lactobacillus pentosus] [Lactiplantibacillus mudanjiangensis]VDG30715.1 phosphohydrolase [Lactobacillus pentosus] [Lactiplantibacillus mudanjiangensis]